MSMLGWKKLFANWPSDMPRRGVLLTTLGEQVPFDGFLLSEEFLLIERPTPDTSGARAMILPFDYVGGVKLTDVLKPKALQSLGLEGVLTKR